jgi:hypothetical protein
MLRLVSGSAQEQRWKLRIARILPSIAVRAHSGPMKYTNYYEMHCRR